MWPWPDPYISFVRLFWWDCSSAYPCCKRITALRHIPNSIQTCNCQTPSEKKTSLDPNDLKKNFRPVSNLSFFSKLSEKVVMSQLLDHLNTNELWPRFQSAYRASHSKKPLYLESLTIFLLLVMVVKCLFSHCQIWALPLTLLTMTSSSIGSKIFLAYRIRLFLSSDPI